MVKGAHPYHYWQEKNFIQCLVDYLVPMGMFFVLYLFYNHNVFSSKEMIKTTGLLAIALLSLTLIVGPLSRIFPPLTILKAHRKVWGILSFVAALAHAILVVIFYYKFSFAPFINFNSPKYPALLTGLSSLVILFMVTLTSNQVALKKLPPKVWKAIQVTSYLALILAAFHFYLVESVNGVFIVKRLLGKVVFWFAVGTIIARVVVMFLPSKKK